MAEQNRPSKPNGLKPLPKPVRQEPPGRSKTSAKHKRTPAPSESRPLPASQDLPVRNIDPDDFDLDMNRPQRGGTPYRSSRMPGRKAGTQQRPAEPTMLEAFQIFLRRTFNARNKKRRGKGNPIPMNRIVGMASMGLVCFALVVLLIWSLTNKNAYEVSLNDKIIGYITKAKDIDETAMQAQSVSHLEASLGARVQVNENVAIKLVHASKSKISSYSDIIDAISRGFSYKIAACAIYVDGNEIAVLRTQAEAESVAKQLQAPFVKEDVHYVSKTFVEDWQLITKLVDQEELDTAEDALIQLDKTSHTMEDYTIQSGDMLGTIARRNNTTVDKICADNPGLTANSVLKVGQTIQLETTKPYLSVVTVEEIIRKETIPMQVENQDNPLEYKTYTKVLQEGKDGEREITVRITRINGIQTEPEQIIGTRTTVEAVNRIVEVGTSEAAPVRH